MRHVTEWAVIGGVVHSDWVAREVLLGICDDIDSICSVFSRCLRIWGRQLGGGSVAEKENYVRVHFKMLIVIILANFLHTCPWLSHVYLSFQVIVFLSNYMYTSTYIFTCMYMHIYIAIICVYRLHWFYICTSICLEISIYTFSNLVT